MKLRILAAALLSGTVLMAGPAQAEDLRDALVSVYNKNPRLLAERARLREIDETYVQARAQGRFTVSGTATATQVWAKLPDASALLGPAAGTDPLSVSGRPNDVGLQIVQPLYQGGRVKALKAQAKLSILAARENLRAQENALFLSAANAYVDVLRDEETARIRRNNVSVLSRQLEAATIRFDVGQGTRTDIAQSESRMALAEAGLAQAESQLAVSRADFVRFVGRRPDVLSAPPKFVLPLSLPAAIKAARENNPQLIGAYFNEAAGRAAIDAAKSAGKPTIALSGNLQRQRAQLSNIREVDAASITAQITVPLYSGGGNRSRVRQAQHTKTRLAFETRDAELQIDQAVTQIWAQLSAAKASLKAARRQKEAAEIAFEGVSLEQSVGTRDQLDVLNAEQEVLNASLAMINAERNVNAATFSLLSTMGVFDAEGIRLSVNNYDPNENLERIRYEGLTSIVDKYAPEFTQKIGAQIPNIAEDVTVGVGELYEDSPIETAVRTVGAIASEGAELSKRGVDTVTGQTLHHHDLYDQTAIEIVTDPINPPSNPPFDPLLDDDSNGENDKKYTHSDSPVD